MITLFSLIIPDALDPEVFDILLSRLSPGSREKILRKLQLPDRMRSLWAEVLVRTRVCSILGVRNAAIVFSKNEFGKPLLQNDPCLHFNVSHSGDAVLCAFDHTPVGVDVEAIKGRNVEIAERFFSRTEHAWLLRGEETGRLERFIDLWTLKESYLKAIGRGISKGLASFTIHPDGEHIAVDDDENENARKEYFFRRFFITAGYKAAVCAQNDDFPASAVMVRPDDLLTEFMKYS